MSVELYQAIGTHNADILALKEDIKEIKENQKAMINFINEQKAGRKYIWMIFTSIAAIATFARDIGSFFVNLFSLKGLR